MGLVSVLMALALLAQAPPFTETFGPNGEVKRIGYPFVSCDGRTQVQAENALADLVAADNDAEAAYALKLNKCTFVNSASEAETTILKVIDKRCIQEIRTPDSHYCKFEYYLFQVQGRDGHRYYAIYAPTYE